MLYEVITVRIADRPLFYFGILTFINQDTHTIYIIVALLILGFGFGMFSSPNTNSIMSSVEKKHLGLASATVSTMRTTRITSYNVCYTKLLRGIIQNHGHKLLAINA